MAGVYEINVRQINKAGFIKSNLQITVYEQPIFHGIIID